MHSAIHAARPRASLLLFTVRDVPVYAHATLPLGLAFASRFSFRPMIWLGVALVVLVHEAGHAALFRRYRCAVRHIVLHGFGGECAGAGRLTPWQRAAVAWGGVLAQALLLAVVIVLGATGVWPTGPASSDLFHALTVWNAKLIAFNLLPIGGLDGTEAWAVLRLGYLRLKLVWMRRKLARMENDRAPSTQGRFLH